MICSVCATPNPAQARYCLHCGQATTPGIVCGTCHTLLPSNANYCFHCGDLIISVHQQCPDCGANTTSGQVICGNCGSQLIQVTVTTSVQPASQPVAQQQVQINQQQGDIRDSDIADTDRAHKEETVITARPLTAMLPSLKRYLPEAFYEPLERRPNDNQLTAARDHLTSLLRTATTYLPRPVVVSPQLAGEPAGGIHQGTFLFVDVSGFTPLSERLSQFGRSGAEQVTNIINDLFSDMVGILFKHGGSLLKFGGDALLGLFPASTDEELTQTALHAAQTAMEMQNAMVKFAAIEAGGDSMALRIKCGISTGPYFAAHIGNTTNMAYVTTGHTVNGAEQAEGNAEPGEVILEPVSYSLIKDQVEVEKRNESHHLLIAVKDNDQEHTSIKTAPIPADDNPPGDIQTQLTYLVDRLDRLTPYLAADLLPRMVNNPDNVRISPDHRPVTVMFVNYRGISDLIEDMGQTRPEIITQQLNRYFCHMADIVEKYEGTLARMDQYAVGDRLVVFFGAPRAHEDDPVRAVYTALEMQAATQEYFSALQTGQGIYRFDQRIGINTGHLFAGNVGASNLRQEYTLMGDDINMAARLMSKASWEEIFVSKKTEERVTAYIELENKGSLKVKGKDILIPTYKVLRRRQETGQIRGFGGDSPLIGRRKELIALQDTGHTFLNGRGQILSIIGDSGLGKSRMKRELNSWIFEQVERKKLNWFEGQCLSFSERVSNWLIIQLIQSSLGLNSDASKDDILFTLWRQAESLLGKETAREAVPFIANLLRLQLEGEWAQWVEELEPRVRQKQTFWAVRQYFTAIARKTPTVVSLEDLHWADEASLALIDDLLTVSDQAPLMFCLVFREIRDKGCWQLRNNAAGSYPHRYIEVQLKPLSKANSRRLLNRLLPGAKFAQETIEDILNKSAGNPYYLEEVVRSLIENGAVVPQTDQPDQWQITDMIDQIAVPDTLQGAIVSRLDRLEEDVRQGLQMAAVIGRKFQANLLRGLSQTENEVDRWLSELERVGLIRLTEEDQTGGNKGAKIADLLDILIGDSPQAAANEEVQTYTFPDALVQEVAYDSMLVKRRQQFHRQVGEALEHLFDDQLEEESEMLAYHFGHSDDLEKAIFYLEKAGKMAQAGFANETALEHYTNLLSHLSNQGTDWEKMFRILNARQQVYSLLGNQDGRERDILAMIALAEANSDVARRGNALNAQADLYQWTGKYDQTIEKANEAYTIMESIGEKAGQAEALHQIGVVNYYQGKYEQAQPALEQSASLRRFINDPAGESWSELYLCMINFVTGNYGEAILHNDRALQAAESRQDWLQMGIHLNNGARISHRLGEYKQALSQFRKSLEFRERVGDRTGQGFTLFGIGLVYLYLEQFEEAKSALQESLAIRQAIEDERGVSYTLQGLGLVALGQNKLDRAIEYFEQARDLHTKLNLNGELVADLSYLGQVYLKMERLEEAAQLSGKSIALLAEHKNVEEVQQIYLNHYRVLSALDDPGAGKFLQQANDAMLNQAMAINDPKKRKTFLEKVRVNQAITAEIAESDWSIDHIDPIKTTANQATS